jgi:hypothetical protein
MSVFYIIEYLAMFIADSCYVFQEAQRALKAANKPSGGAVSAAPKGSDGKSVRVVEGKLQVKLESASPLSGVPDSKKAAVSKGQSCVSGVHASMKKSAQQTGAAIGNLSNVC